MSNVLLVASDQVGERMAGPGIRAFELGRALSMRHKVTLAVPPPLPPSATRIAIVEARRSVLAMHAPRHDVVVVQGSAFDLLPHGPDLPPLVIDLYDPFPIEGLQIHAGEALPDRVARHRSDLDLLRRQAGAGDLFICASSRQRLFWVGALTALGRVNPQTFDDDADLDNLIRLVPFGVSDTDPSGSVPDDPPTIVWGGGVWNWFDPLTLLRALPEVRRRVPGTRVRFLGTTHPNPAVPAQAMMSRTRALARELGLADAVNFVEGWTPYAERGAALGSARIGVSLNLPGIEADLAFRTRVLDYIWSALPVVVTEGDEIADLVEARGIGLTVRPCDEISLAAALVRLLSDTDLAQRCATAAGVLRDELRWSRVVASLAAFCDAPVTASDRRGARIRPPSATRRGLRLLRSQGVVAFSRRSARRLRKLF